MLGGKNNGIQPQGLPILVIFHRDLSLSVRAQALYHPRFSGKGEGTGEPMSQHNRQRHHLRGFRAGIAHHHALIPGSQQHGGVIFTEVSSSLQ